jgi:hypothetical protein
MVLKRKGNLESKDTIGSTENYHEQNLRAFEGQSTIHPRGGTTMGLKSFIYFQQEGENSRTIPLKHIYVLKD